MKLSSIVHNILTEEAEVSSPSTSGQQPVAPAPTETSTFYDVNTDLQSFQTTVDSQEEKAKRSFDDLVKKKILNKSITTRASKGAVGQIEKDYKINVVDVNVIYLKDKYYVVIKGDDKKEYYVNPGFKIRVESQPEVQEPRNPNQSQAKTSLGGIVHQPVIGTVSKN